MGNEANLAAVGTITESPDDLVMSYNVEEKRYEYAEIQPWTGWKLLTAWAIMLPIGYGISYWTITSLYDAVVMMFAWF